MKYIAAQGRFLHVVCFHVLIIGRVCTRARAGCYCAVVAVVGLCHDYQQTMQKV